MTVGRVATRRQFTPYQSVLRPGMHGRVTLGKDDETGEAAAGEVVLDAAKDGDVQGVDDLKEPLPDDDGIVAIPLDGDMLDGDHGLRNTSAYSCTLGAIRFLLKSTAKAR